MNRADYEIFIYEGLDNFTDEMVQEIKEMSGEEGDYFEHTGSSIEIRETPWDPYVDMPEWSKKHPEIVFEIHLDYEDEDEDDILYIKNGKCRYVGDEANFREELLTVPGKFIKGIQCISWSPSFFFNSKDVNPKPLNNDERYIVVGKDDTIGVGSYKNENWEAPFEVVYWKHI